LEEHSLKKVSKIKLTACLLPPIYSAYASTLKMEVIYSSRTLVNFYQTIYGITSQKTIIFIVTTVRTSIPEEVLDS
jgi:hypothetical protein